MIKGYTAEGIILSRRNIGEADKLITIFTKQYGKKVVIAKGIRRITSRRAPHLEPFTHLKLFIHPGKRFDLVSETMSLHTFPVIRKRLERVGYTYIALELIERLTAENQESTVLYKQLLDFLHFLNAATTSREEAQQHLYTFKAEILVELGFLKKATTYSFTQLDTAITEILEHKLKSAIWLTNMQSLV